MKILYCILFSLIITQVSGQKIQKSKKVLSNYLIKSEYSIYSYSDSFILKYKCTDKIIRTDLKGLRKYYPKYELFRIIIQKNSEPLFSGREVFGYVNLKDTSDIYVSEKFNDVFSSLKDIKLEGESEKEKFIRKVVVFYSDLLGTQLYIADIKENEGVYLVDLSTSPKKIKEPDNYLPIENGIQYLKLEFYFNQGKFTQTKFFNLP
jgi:hypothetical protein